MINYVSFIGIGFIIGILSGLFGVGGGFLLVPLLNAVFNIPYNIAIGSSLCQMVGTSSAASLKHKGYGNIVVNQDDESLLKTVVDFCLYFINPINSTSLIGSVEVPSN